MRRDVRIYLQEMQVHLTKLTRIVGSKTEQQFLEDEVLRLAVERLYITTCTIIRRMEEVSADVQNRIESVAQIVGFRNLLVHEYDKIEDEEVWKITQQSLPKLREQINAWAAELGMEAPPDEPPSPGRRGVASI